MRLLGLMCMMNLLTLHVLNAFAGGDYDALNTAYVQQVALPQTIQTDCIDIKEPDLGDKLYVWLRTKVSGWVIMGTFLFGAITIAGHKFRKEIKVWLRGVLAD